MTNLMLSSPLRPYLLISNFLHITATHYSNTALETQDETAPTAPPHLPKTDEVEIPCQSSQMVPLMRETIPKSTVTAVKANLPTRNLSVATQHLWSNTYGPKTNKSHQMKTFTCPVILLLLPFSCILLSQQGKWGSGFRHKNELPFILYHANPKYF